jgi:hypothetical protein
MKVEATSRWIVRRPWGFTLMFMVSVSLEGGRGVEFMLYQGQNLGKVKGVGRRT